MSVSAILAQSGIAHALADLARLGTEVMLDGTGDRIRYVFDGQQMDEVGILGLARMRRWCATYGE